MASRFPHIPARPIVLGAVTTALVVAAATSQPHLVRGGLLSDVQYTPKDPKRNLVGFIISEVYKRNMSSKDAARKTGFTVQYVTKIVDIIPSGIDFCNTKALERFYTVIMEWISTACRIAMRNVDVL